MIEPLIRDKVVLVTGAQHGIGEATAKAFAEQGARVFITFLSYEEKDASLPEKYRAQLKKSADDTLTSIRKFGGTAEAFEADLSDASTIPIIFDRAESAFGKVDILVNNAASWCADTFLPSSATAWGAKSAVFSLESYEHNFSVNSRAIALMIGEYARRHVRSGKNWGRIISVSTGGSKGFPGEVSYGASKNALESFSRAASTELGPFGVTVNVVMPGPIQTGYMTAETAEKIGATIPLRRIGMPTDVADVVVFLASEQARWVSGQVVYVGGGG